MWIKLYFYLKRESEPVLHPSNYSSELQDSIRRCMGYQNDLVYSTTVTKLFSIFLEEIERWHRWNNESDTRSKMYHLQLDILSPEAQELVPRYDEDIELEYWIMRRSNSAVEPDIVVTGSFKFKATAEIVKDDLEKNRQGLHTYYIKSCPEGVKPYQLR
jgi:hypothetical protein